VSDAADKLAKTRLAIIEHIYRKDRRHERPDAQDEGDADESGDPWYDEPDHGSGPAGWFAQIKHAAQSWWRQHPASLGLEMATPALSAYAGRKPLQFLGIAAAVGAVVVVTRPWRLISLTGVLVALAKSSQLSGLLMSAMTSSDLPRSRKGRRRR
jgi:hypothetical protein